VPFAVITVFLTIAGSIDTGLPGSSYYVALAVGCGLGALCLWPVVRDLRWRWLLIAGYLAAMGTAKFMYSILFACSAFGDCL
jgi:hypothetical protein